jgi:hypothetical protein
MTLGPERLARRRREFRSYPEPALLHHRHHSWGQCYKTFYGRDLRIFVIP